MIERKLKAPTAEEVYYTHNNPGTAEEDECECNVCEQYRRAAVAEKPPAPEKTKK